VTTERSGTPVAATDRVSDVLARDEMLVEVFVRHAPHFEKLRNAAMRRVMARLVTVEQAARMAAVPVDRLLSDLNAALHIETSQAAHSMPERAGPRPAARANQHPASLRQIELDLREDMRSGREPFSRIMEAVATLGPGEVLLLRTIFEPVPLFGLMAKRGFQHEVERHSADDWSIWFWRGEREAPPGDPDVGDMNSPSAATLVAPSSRDDTLDGEAVERPTEWLDVRGLEPPEPLVRTLAALESLPDGHQLIQINARVPQLLLPMLSERGFACEVDSSDVDQVRVRIWRALPH
jgi:uncharacterized protein (DUF2249 family)